MRVFSAIAFLLGAALVSATNEVAAQSMTPAAPADGSAALRVGGAMNTGHYHQSIEQIIPALALPHSMSPNPACRNSMSSYQP
jgi:hypothetical protein